MRIKLLTSMAVAAALTACTDSSSTTSTTSSGGADGGTTTGGCSETGPNISDPAANEIAEVEGGAGEFGCWETATALGPSRMVPVSGCVAIFGVGNAVTNGLKIAVYDDDQNPGPGGDEPAYGTRDIVRNAASGCESEGEYSFERLPTNKPLIFKTFDTSASPQAVDTYEYGVVIRADHHDEDGNGQYRFEANLIFNATYTAIPNTAGRSIEGGNVLTDKSGKGALAGGVRDCRGEGRTVKNAKVGGSCIDARTKLVYFNGNDDSPSPDLRRSTTNTDGLFAAVNVPTTSATGVKGQAQELEARVRLADGRVLSSGPRRVVVFPDSVTIYSPAGLLPTMDTPSTSSSTMTQSSSAQASSNGNASSTAASSSSTTASSAQASSSGTASSAEASSSGTASSAEASSSEAGSSSAAATSASSDGTGSSSAP